LAGTRAVSPKCKACFRFVCVCVRCLATCALIAGPSLPLFSSFTLLPPHLSSLFRARTLSLKLKHTHTQGVDLGVCYNDSADEAPLGGGEMGSAGADGKPQGKKPKKKLGEHCSREQMLHVMRASSFGCLAPPPTPTHLPWGGSAEASVASVSGNLPALEHLSLGHSGPQALSLQVSQKMGRRGSMDRGSGIARHGEVVGGREKSGCVNAEESSRARVARAADANWRVCPPGADITNLARRSVSLDNVRAFMEAKNKERSLALALAPLTCPAPSNGDGVGARRIVSGLGMLRVNEEQHGEAEESEGPCTFNSHTSVLVVSPSDSSAGAFGISPKVNEQQLGGCG
jgi:hypothetical protein